MMPSPRMGWAVLTAVFLICVYVFAVTTGPVRAVFGGLVVLLGGISSLWWGYLKEKQ